jgi:hypothetical protein
MRATVRVATAVLLSIGACAARAASDPWTDLATAALPPTAPQPADYRIVALDIAALRDALGDAPGGTALLSLPLPDGGVSTFALSDSGTMPPALRQKFPQIESLAGRDAQGRRARVDLSELGLHGRVFAPEGGFVVAPLGDANSRRYIVYRRDRLPPRTQPLRCGFDASFDRRPAQLRDAPASPATITGATRRNYRVAVAATAPYVAAVGNGSVSGGLAAVVATLNRVNEVYESEFAIHLTLVANNDLVIYANAANDPYLNSLNDVGQNTANLDAVIGTANYDVGHVLTTADGGMAYAASTCQSATKGGGSTGQANPQGDPFDIDYVAHELGHQFGAVHSFNGCEGEGTDESGYEPGSGSTIMGYAGLCGADDLQPHSDPYFHAKSLQDINRWTLIFGGTCAQNSPNPNAVPAIAAASLPTGKTIPARTAFALTASATDPDGDALTYAWEQFDLGAVTTLADGDVGNGPILRSVAPTSSPTRLFPRLSTILGGPAAPGEILPTTTRPLNFRLTVRDNRADDGRSTSADVALNVTSAAGPFVLTLPNGALAWGRGETRLVGWNVANTDVAPVGCTAVDIALSTDGGATFAQPLATAVPNSGLAAIVVPAVTDTNAARVRISCATNVFFDVSDANFTIGATGTPDPAIDAIFADGFDPP